MKRQLQIEVVSDRVSVLGESPVWCSQAQALYWVDIRGEKINRVSSDGKGCSWNTGKRIGALGLAANGGMIATMDDGLYAMDPDPTATDDIVSRRLIAQPALANGVRLKEGKVDPSGRYWCGSTGSRERAEGGLFRLDLDGSCEQVDKDFILVNGIAFSPDARTLIVADTIADNVFAYDFDANDGHISGKRLFFSSAEFPGGVDGATFDVDGGYWCAFVHDGCIGRIDPSGRLDRLIRLPVRDTTMCAFGGANLDVLYVTTASCFLSEIERPSQPLAGSLFAIRGTGAQGVPEPLYRGR